jgi:hypothetical protein
MKYIGLCGKMGTGKDYIASNIIMPYIENIIQKKGIIWSFADQLKVNVMIENNLKYKELYVNKTHKTRKLLQEKGTEKGRNIYGKDIWIRYLNAWSEVLQHKGYDYVIVPDVRFIEEIDYIKSKCGVIFKIEAPNRNKRRIEIEKAFESQFHSSETSLDKLDKCKFDYVIKNDDCDFLDVTRIISFVKETQ